LVKEACKLIKMVYGTCKMPRGILQQLTLMVDLLHTRLKSLGDAQEWRAPCLRRCDSTWNQTIPIFGN
jgi:hypothetical protein